MNNRLSWRFTALASTVALLGSFASFQVAALGLGSITVQSALGEPLNAEIDIVEINAEEAASLKAGVASADAFKAAGLDYNAAMTDVRVSLAKRANGRSYLRLTSTRPVTEPFVDLILETSWSAGRIVRDYTMLFDPPGSRPSGLAGSTVAPVAPVVSLPLPLSPPVAAITIIPPAAPAARIAPVTKVVPTAPKTPAGNRQVTVKPNDTAGKIAAQNRPDGLSLDQMLVALLRNNPDAFIGGNVNRIKAGSVLNVPGQNELAATAPADASQIIAVQSRDFNAFRRKLAEGVPNAQVDAANRQAAGKVQAKVDDRAPTAATPDKLTLSKGAVQGRTSAEEKIVKDRLGNDASNRVAELSKNIGDLNRLAGAPLPGAVTSAASAPGRISVDRSTTVLPASAPAPPSIATSAPGAAKPASAALVTSPGALNSSPNTATGTNTIGIAGSNPAFTVINPASAPPVSASASAAGASVAAVASNAATSPVIPPGKKPVAASLPLEPALTDNPLLLPGLGLLLLLLAGFGFYRYRQNNRMAQVDSSFLESRLQPDSFFGASGGQRIDTNEGAVAGSSLVYSPSQLDAAGDVDPVAEADVYLAYGRDLQAEEILKEALRTSPTRVAIHSKLMEIYAKRRDVKAFNLAALEAFKLTRGEGTEWVQIAEMGRQLDPVNPLYSPGGQPKTPGNKESVVKTDNAAAFASSTIPQMLEPHYGSPSPAVDFDLDLDLDFSSDSNLAGSHAVPIQTPVKGPQQLLDPTIVKKVEPIPVLDMDLGPETLVLEPVPDAPFIPTPAPKAVKPEIFTGSLDFTTKPLAVPTVGATPAPPVVDSGMLEFDLGSLSLELDAPAIGSPAMKSEAETALPADGLLETKFSLAEEFRTLGDTDGARALAEEVLAQASGPLKVKAQAFVNTLP